MSGFNLHITLDMVRTGLSDIVERFGPDHTAGAEGGKGCVYAVSEGGRLQAVCIVGQFFSDLGILRALTTVRIDAPYDVQRMLGDNLDTNGFEDEDYCNLGGFNLAVRHMLEGRYDITLEDKAFEYLKEAQRIQDGGSPWGHAVEAATLFVTR